jgi:hypothetical protein
MRMLPLAASPAVPDPCTHDAIEGKSAVASFSTLQTPRREARFRLTARREDSKSTWAYLKSCEEAAPALRRIASILRACTWITPSYFWSGPSTNK